MLDNREMVAFIDVNPWYTSGGTTAASIVQHYGDVVMGAIASPLLTKPFIQTHIKENIKAPRHWPLCGEFTGDRWIPRTNGQ